MKLHTLTAVARTLGKRYGVEVKIQGATAHTNGREIVLPDLGNEPDETRLTLLRGYLDHEAGGHCRHTDFKVWPKDGDPTVRSMLNLIEDIRVEALLGREFSGCHKNLTELNAHLFAEAGAASNPLTLPLLALQVNGFKLVAAQPLALDVDPKPALAWFGADVFDRIAACASTADCLALAEDLVHRLEETMRRLLAQSRLDIKGQDAAARIAERRAAEIGELLEALRHHRDKGERLAQALAQLHDDSLDEGRYVVYSRAEDRIVPVLEDVDDETYHALRDSLGRLNTLRWRVVQAFHSERAARWVGDREQGRINGRALAGIETGNIRVFKEWVQTPRVHTAASFLVDCSGSMHRGGRIRNAMAAVVLFLESLHQAGAACEVLGYTTRGTYALPKADRERYGRVDKLLVLVFKSFVEPFSSSVRRRIAGYEDLDMEWTCIVDPLLIAYERLAARPEPRKILFLLTDGDVSSNGNDAAGRRELRRVARAIEREGRVELLAIDLMSGHTKKYCTKRIEVQRAGELAANLLEGLKTHLFAGRGRRARRRRSIP